MIEFVVMMNLICQEIEEEKYAKTKECTMLIRKLPPYMPQPLNNLELWSCKRRPTLCLVAKEQ